MAAPRAATGGDGFNLCVQPYSGVQDGHSQHSDRKWPTVLAHAIKNLDRACANGITYSYEGGGI